MATSQPGRIPAAGNLESGGGDRYHIIIIQITIALQLVIMKERCRKPQEHKGASPRIRKPPTRKVTLLKPWALHVPPFLRDFCPRSVARTGKMNPDAANAVICEL